MFPRNDEISMIKTCSQAYKRVCRVFHILKLCCKKYINKQINVCSLILKRNCFFFCVSSCKYICILKLYKCIHVCGYELIIFPFSTGTCSNFTESLKTI